MQRLIIKGTQKTPEVNFDSQTGMLLIGGRSYSSDAFEFYKPITAWINKYLEDPKDKTIMQVNVDYFHSVSVKYLSSIIKKLEQLKDVKIVWVHQEEDDEDESLELGKAIERGSKIQFEFVTAPQIRFE